MREKNTGTTRCTTVHKHHFSCQGTKASWLIDTLWRILLSKWKKILLFLLWSLPSCQKWHLVKLAWELTWAFSHFYSWNTKPEATTVDTEKHTCRDKNYKERCGVVAMPVMEESKKAARKYQWVLFLFGSSGFYRQHSTMYSKIKVWNIQMEERSAMIQKKKLLYKLSYLGSITSG